MKYILLFIPLQVFAQYNISPGISLYIERLPDTVDSRNQNIEYVNNWYQMDRANQQGAFPNADNCKMILNFTGSGIDIFTESFDGHSYYDISIDGSKERIEIEQGLNVYDILTFSKKLEYGDHVLEIEAPKYGFVFNKALIKHDYAPKVRIDTVYQDKLIYVNDTVYLQRQYYLKIDSEVIELIEK